MQTDKKNNLLAFSLSCVAHIIGLLILSIALPITAIKKEPQNLLPITFVVNETIIKKTPPKPLTTPKKPIAQTAQKKQVPKPTSLPGDQPKSTVTTKQIPIYPKDAINFGQQGTITVEVLVNTKGYASSIKTLKSSGYPQLDKAFIASIKSGYEFKPKRIMGVNKTDKIKLSYTFKL